MKFLTMTAVLLSLAAYGQKPADKTACNTSFAVMAAKAVTLTEGSSTAAQVKAVLGNPTFMVSIGTAGTWTWPTSSTTAPMAKIPTTAASAASPRSQMV
jgi:outer membrane protein assembly factor BamE (lipoprotein component of BamABCDE complex)